MGSYKNHDEEHKGTQVSHDDENGTITRKTMRVSTCLPFRADLWKRRKSHRCHSVLDITSRSCLL